jgi:hypothetical protein
MNKKVVIILCIIVALLIFSIYFFKVFSHYKNIMLCPSEIKDIIGKYNIDKNQIVGCWSKPFIIENKAIKLISLEYGQGQDCPSGCIFSHYCAIVEDNKDYPYALFCLSQDENILSNVSNDCSNISKNILPGRTHPLTLTPEFKEFLNNSRDNHFRECIISSDIYG